VLISNGATNNALGGTSGTARNVISGNNGSGVFLTDADTSGNSIQGNFIGPDATGASAVPNGYEGIYIVGGASGNFIGGTSAGAGNVISGNTLRGIYAYGTNTSGNLIQGNFIGTQADGTNALGNGWDGVVFFDGASSNVVGLAASGSGAGNKIAFNGFTGVYVGSDNNDMSVGNTLRGNNIFSNNYIGINLAGGTEDGFGVTANHSGGPGVGPNDLQNYPVLASVAAYPGSTIIGGALNGAPGRSYLVDVYWNTTADPSGHGEGQFYVGSANLNTDGSGNGSFTLTTTSNLTGKSFTATATDTTTGDTGEFSANVLATSGPPQFVGPYAFSGSSGFSLNFVLQTNLHYRIQTATNLGVQPIPWIDLTNFTANNSPLQFTDSSATNRPTRFYRIVSP
jgi:titin